MVREFFVVVKLKKNTLFKTTSRRINKSKRNTENFYFPAKLDIWGTTKEVRALRKW